MSSTVVLITGANSGVGYATSKRLVGTSECFHIIMTGRSLERCESAKADLESEGIKGSLSVMQLDVTDKESILKAAASVERQFGKLDVLVNNAGVGGFEPDMGTRFQICFQTNVIGPALVSEAFRPLLLQSQTPTLSSHEERTGWGQAGDPDVSGGIVLDIVQGKRDRDVGSFVHKDGVYPW
ncbi:hypothetical protein SCUP515_12569 [Seiridium cupressi]